jgi:hypothetical protein
MSFNEYHPINLQNALLLSENIAKSKSPKAKFILDLIVNKKDRGYLNLCYAYLRWVDDLVDDPQKIITDKIEFISRQKKLAEDFSNSQSNSQINNEESFLFFFISYAIAQNKLFLIDAVKTMLESIEMDTKRLSKDGIYTAEEKQLYVDKNSKAFFNIMTGFVEPKSSLISKNIYIGRFATRLFMLRDFVDDSAIGFINITKEDLDTYSIDKLNLLNDTKIKNWAKDEFEKLIKLLFEEAVIVRTFSIKLRIFNYFSQIYYLPKIIRLKINNFNFHNIKNKRALRDKIRVYMESLRLGIKLFSKEFFKF